MLMGDETRAAVGRVNTFRAGVLVAVLAVASLLLGGVPTPDAQAAASRSVAVNRVVTWGASHVRLDDPEDFGDMTVRNLVHTSIGGTGLQVTLSNAFGDRPVTFAPVTVAVQAEDAAIVPETQHQLTFDGETAVTIEPGDTAQSDPLDWNVQIGRAHV